MTVIYTHRGFPVQVEPEEKLRYDSIYESPQVTEVWTARKLPNKGGFTEEQVDIAILANEWNIDRGLFVAALDPNSRLTGVVQSFIAETALFITGAITRRRVGFNDWALMLTPATDGSAVSARFEPHERSAIETLAKLTTPALFQRWLSGPGLNDLVETMQLFVGKRDRFSR